MANKDELEVLEFEPTTLDDLRQDEPDLYSLVANWHTEKDEAYEQWLDEVAEELDGQD